MRLSSATRIRPPGQGEDADFWLPTRLHPLPSPQSNEKKGKHPFSLSPHFAYEQSSLKPTWSSNRCSEFRRESPRLEKRPENSLQVFFIQTLATDVTLLMESDNDSLMERAPASPL